METGYQPIENYGIIGNMRTARWWAWMAPSTGSACPTSIRRACLPPSSTIAKGGRFRIAPVSRDVRHKQFYWPDTNILVTRFLHADGVGEVEDYMPVGGAGLGAG